MLDASTLFKNEIRENSKCQICGEIVLANGKKITLAGKDFIANTSTFDSATSSSGTFEIGAAIIGSFSCVLNNFDEKFSGYDFSHAVFHPIITKLLSDGSTEQIPKGIFEVEQPKSISTTISISAYDNMKLFEKPYSKVGTVFPANLQTILNDVCTYCGVILETQRFDNYSFVINKCPKESDTMTCLDVVSYVAQMAGCFAKINVRGSLELLWYEMDAFKEQNYNGGSFGTKTTPYSDGDTLDGGNFEDYSSGSRYDGGFFTDPRPYNVYGFRSFTICTDDVVVTGVKVAVDTKTSYLHGSEGYVLSIENNPFISADNMKAVGEFLGAKLIGMWFRPFNVTALADPTLEAGDAVALLKDGNIYNSYVTHTNYKIGNYQTIECNAETPSANSSTRYRATTKSYVRAREEAQRQLDAYDLAMQQLTNLMANSFGVFKTEEKKVDGSVIYYMHNKPTLAASSTIWKMTADAFAVSTDGGKTWNAGFTSSGDAVVNVLSAIGINADWINAGSIAADIIIGGILKSKNYVYGVSGTRFDLENGALNTPNLWWDETGHLHASDADVSGTIKSTNAEITGGKILIDTDSKDNSYIGLAFGNLKTMLKPGGLRLGYTDSSNLLVEVGDSSSTLSLTHGSGNSDSMLVSIGDVCSLDISKSGMINASIVESESSSYAKFAYGTAAYIAMIASSSACSVSAHRGGAFAYFSPSGISTSGDISCSGTKSRVAGTNDYDERLLYCYETPTPMFGDIGEGIIDETRKCYVWLDDVFAETIDSDCQYQVFLQPYGDGNAYVSERLPSYFIVQGTKNLKFGWEVKATQKAYDTVRLEKYEKPQETEEDVQSSTYEYLQSLLFNVEREVI